VLHLQRLQSDAFGKPSCAENTYPVGEHGYGDRALLGVVHVDDGVRHYLPNRRSRVFADAQDRCGIVAILVQREYVFLEQSVHSLLRKLDEGALHVVAAYEYALRIEQAYPGIGAVVEEVWPL
jgi:hypothetical protein